MDKSCGFIHAEIIAEPLAIIMKKGILFIIILTTIVSCQEENKKSDFIGNWSSTSDTNVEIDVSFFKDSMVIDNSLMNGTYSDKWKIKGSKIEQTLLRGDTTVLNNKNTIDFKFSPTKDTLLIKSKSDSIFHIKLRRIKNNFEYFENYVGLSLKLPKTSEKLTSIGNKELAFPIYLGKQKDSIVYKTDRYFQRFDKLEQSVISYYYSNKAEERDSLKFTLFTDNSIKTKELDSIKRILRKLPIKKFFRIYDDEKYINDDWKAEINWVGKYEN